MKQFKCQGECGEFKDATEFYTSKSGRASPYCIKCNPNAALLMKYKTQIRREGSEAFVGKIKAKENQLRLMLQAASETHTTYQK